MKKAKADASVLLLILIVLLICAGIVFTISYLRLDPIDESLKGDKVINALFVIEDKDKPLCSYVLMYYPETKRAAIFDIPGTVGLIIKSINRVDRIDKVYDPNRITPFTKEIENLLGIEIPFSIVITLENLGKITDLLEGVELFIHSPVDEYQDGYILFPSGLSFLDGDKAKVYVTYELSDESSELAVHRRQRFFVGLIKRIGIQNSYLKTPQTARIFHSLFKTGIKTQSQIRLFDEFAGIDVDRINIQSVSGNAREVSGQILLFPHWDGNLIKDIVRQTLGSLIQPTDGALGDRVLTVEVLNGTSVTGIAGRTAELFKGFGYDVIAIGNADRNDFEKTLIIDRSGYEDIVTSFAGVIRCDNIRLQSHIPAETEMDFMIQDYNYQADITLIIGKDFNGRYVTK